MAVQGKNKSQEENVEVKGYQEAPKAFSSFADIVMNTNRSSGRANSADVNKALVIMKQDIVDGTGTPLERFSVMNFIGANYGLNVSGIVTHTAVNNKVFYHLIVVASACELPQRQQTIGTQTLDIVTSYSDLCTDEVFAHIERELGLFYKGKVKIEEFYDSNVSVLHDLEYASSIIQYATDSIIDLMAATGDADGFNFNVKSLQGLSPRATVAYNGISISNSESLPTRNDISVTVTGAQQRGNGQDPLVLPLSRVAGFINLNYTTPTPMQTPMGQIATTKQYSPEFVITSNQSLFQANSLPVLAFSLYAATAGLKDNNWLNVFKPVFGGSKARNLRDIGAINYDVPPTGNPDVDGRMIDTNSEAFLAEGLYSLADTYIHQDVGIAIDISESGAQSWLMSLFTRLIPAAGTQEALEDAQHARGQIINAFDVLTNNAFSRHFPGGDLVYPNIERIHQGTYIGEDGELHDIREIDMLAMLVISGGTESGLEDVYAYTRTFTDVNETHEEVRLRKRWELMRGVVGDSIKQTGWDVRVRFTGATMNALMAGVADNGIAINIDGIRSVSGAPARGYQGMDDYGINPATAGNAFHVQQQQLAGQAVHRGRVWTY